MAAIRPGDVFDRLVVVERCGTDKSRKVLWSCRCDCGEQIQVRAGDLRSGNTRSCGCLRREAAAELASVDLGKRCKECGAPLGERGAGVEYCKDGCRKGYHAWWSMEAALDDPMCNDPDIGGLTLQPLYGPKAMPGEPATTAAWVASMRRDRHETAVPHLKVIGVNDGWSPGRYN